MTDHAHQEALNAVEGLCAGLASESCFCRWANAAPHHCLRVRSHPDVTVTGTVTRYQWTSPPVFSKWTTAPRWLDEALHDELTSITCCSARVGLAILKTGDTVRRCCAALSGEPGGSCWSCRSQTAAAGVACAAPGHLPPNPLRSFERRLMGCCCDGAGRAAVLRQRRRAVGGWWRSLGGSGYHRLLGARRAWRVGWRARHRHTHASPRAAAAPQDGVSR